MRTQRDGAQTAAPAYTLGKPGPLGREAVDVGREDLRLAVTTQVAVTKIVGKDEDDVRPVVSSHRAPGEERQAQDEDRRPGPTVWTVAHDPKKTQVIPSDCSDSARSP